MRLGGPPPSAPRDAASDDYRDFARRMWWRVEDGACLAAGVAPRNMSAFEFLNLYGDADPPPEVAPGGEPALSGVDDVLEGLWKLPRDPERRLLYVRQIVATQKWDELLRQDGKIGRIVSAFANYSGLPMVGPYGANIAQRRVRPQDFMDFCDAYGLTVPSELHPIAGASRAPQRPASRFSQRVRERRARMVKLMEVLAPITRRLNFRLPLVGPKSFRALCNKAGVTAEKLSPRTVETDVNALAADHKSRRLTDAVLRTETGRLPADDRDDIADAWPDLERAAESLLQR